MTNLNPSNIVTAQYTFVRKQYAYISEDTDDGIAYYNDYGYPRVLLTCTNFDVSRDYMSTTVIDSNSYRICDTWLYFRNINIDQGATVTDGSIRLGPRWWGYNGDSVGFRVFMANQGNATLPTNITEYNNIPLLSSYVDHYYVSDRESYTETGNIGALIQSVVNKPTWENGNSMFFRCRCIAKVAHHTSPAWYSHRVPPTDSWYNPAHVARLMYEASF